MFLYTLNWFQTQKHLIGQASKASHSFNLRIEPGFSNTDDFVCVCACVRRCVCVLICLFECLCMLPGTHKSRFKAHVSVEWQVGSLWGTVMDRAAISDLRRGMDQSQEGGSSEGNTKAAFCFVLSACLSLSSLIIFSIWKYVFAVRVHSKTSLTVQRPK